MSSPRGPRRRRPIDDDDGGGGLPLVPLFAGVIIAGLGIGALLSAWAARHAPVPQHSRAPVVVVHTPTPVAAKVSEASAAPAPSQKATRAPTTAPTTPPPTETPAESPTESATTKATATATRRATATPTQKPSPSASPKRVAQGPTSAPQTAPPIAQNAEASPANTLVLRYLQAVANGDDATARATLGGGTDTSGDVQYLDPSYKVTSISSARSSSGDTTDVQIEFRTVRGQYFGTFRVDPSGKRILLHEIIPVGGTTAR